MTPLAEYFAIFDRRDKQIRQARWRDHKERGIDTRQVNKLSTSHWVMHDHIDKFISYLAVERGLA